jgi:excisionase family DNA binding protein
MPDPPSPYEPGRWLTVNQVAASLGYTPKTIRRMIDEETIPAVMMGGREYRIDRYALDELIAQRSSGQADTRGDADVENEDLLKNIEPRPQ